MRKPLFESLSSFFIYMNEPREGLVATNQSSGNV